MYEIFFYMSFSNLNKEFITGVELERVISENYCFNTKLLEECRKYSESIETKLNEYGGTLLNDQLDLYELKKIHPVGKKLINQETGEVDYPNGLQIRSNMITNTDTVDLFKEIITRRTWNPRRNQVILILLPEEYRYYDDNGNHIIYGIIDGNHRIDAASVIEEFIIAWLIDMPLNKIRKYGNAVCNKVDEAVLGRTDEDIVESILIDLKDKTTDLHQKTKSLKDLLINEDEKQKSINNLWKKEIYEYDVHHKKAGALLRKLQWADTGFDTGNKPWDADRINAFILDECTSSKNNWIPSGETHYDYIDKNGNKIIVCQAEGNAEIIVVHKRARILFEDPKAQIIIYYALAKKFNSTDPEKIAEERDKFVRRLKEASEIIKNAHISIYEDDISPLTRFGYLPQNSQELKDNKLIKRD